MAKEINKTKVVVDYIDGKQDIFYAEIVEINKGGFIIITIESGSDDVDNEFITIPGSFIRKVTEK